MDQPGKNVGETSLGGPSGAFPRTTWGVISRCRDAADLARQQAGLEELCRGYWKPVYRYIRMAWAKTNDEAKDLTQGFFLWLLDGEAIRKFLPEKGSFRGYLKVVLRGFVGDQAKAVHRLKRGGGVRIVPMDAAEFSLDSVIPDPQAADPEKAFDHEWALSVARNAIDRVRRRFTGDGKAVQVQVYEAYDLSTSPEPPTYGEIAGRLGIKEHDVRHYLSAVRDAVQAEIRAELSALAAGVEDIEEEWNVLFGG